MGVGSNLDPSASASLAPSSLRSSSLFYWPYSLHLYQCFCPTDGAARIFLESSSAVTSWSLYIFLPWLGVDAMVVLHLKEGPHITHHWLNRTMVKKKKKAIRIATLPWLGFKLTNTISEADRSILKTTAPCVVQIFSLNSAERGGVKNMASLISQMSVYNDCNKPSLEVAPFRPFLFFFLAWCISRRN